MDARILKAATLAAAVFSLGANYRTPNFVVSAATDPLAREIGTAAERYRKQLAIEWLGREMPTWAAPCPITAEVAPHLGAGGATSFLFEHGEVYGWRMTIQGSHERLLDSVLPHEVTHTIFATHFRRPLPRWADEGACTTVEHASERAKQQMMLVDFLRNGRGIAFSRMLVMKEYPHDVMPLYSQGYSLARYLIAQGGKAKFLNYVADGLRDENWTRATHQHYGYADLAVMQSTWLDWVRRGSPAIDPPRGSAPNTVVAGNDRRARPEPNLIYRAQSDDGAASLPVADAVDQRRSRTESQPAVFAPARPSGQRDWHAPRQTPDNRGSDVTASDDVATNHLAVQELSGQHAAAAVTPGPVDLTSDADRAEAADAGAHQMTRPQPMQKSRQIILEWSRPQRSATAAAADEGNSVYNRSLANNGS